MASILGDDWLFWLWGVLLSMKRRGTDMRCGATTTSGELEISKAKLLHIGFQCPRKMPGHPWNVHCYQYFGIDKTLSKKKTTKPSCNKKHIQQLYVGLTLQPLRQCVLVKTNPAENPKRSCTAFSVMSASPPGASNDDWPGDPNMAAKRPCHAKWQFCFKAPPIISSKM